MKKTIGIIGGMTPKSTALIYNNIIDIYQKKFNDYAFPKIIIYSVSFQNYIDGMKKDNWDSIAEELLKITHSLNKAGADFCIIAANTMHKVFDKIENRSPLPILNIIDAVAEKITDAKIKNVTLLGTRYTMIDSFYRDRLRKFGIKTLVPDKNYIDIIHDIILNELGKEIINNESRKIIINIIEGLNAKGSQGLILGCTELPLIIDTVKILSSQALAYSLN